MFDKVDEVNEDNDVNVEDVNEDFAFKLRFGSTKSECRTLKRCETCLAYFG